MLLIKQKKLKRDVICLISGAWFLIVKISPQTQMQLFLRYVQNVGKKKKKEATDQIHLSETYQPHGGATAQLREVPGIQKQT